MRVVQCSISNDADASGGGDSRRRCPLITPSRKAALAMGPQQQRYGTVRSEGCTRLGPARMIRQQRAFSIEISPLVSFVCNLASSMRPRVVRRSKPGGSDRLSWTVAPQLLLMPSLISPFCCAEEPDLLLVPVVDCWLNLTTCCDVGHFGAFLLSSSRAQSSRQPVKDPSCRRDFVWFVRKKLLQLGNACSRRVGDRHAYHP
ncbi:hypothetical protein GGD65_006397 [Bradyrhizobium sp. CIR18]|nr:hypothetical protein [Bradyrhizobium sp. CIR18]